MTDGAYLAAHGPLGFKNLRKQQGRSVQLGPAVTGVDGLPAPKLKERLVFTGTPGKAEDIDIAEGNDVGDALASTMSITCSIDSLAGPRARVIGTVQWGSDGHATECQFDWIRGTVIQVCGANATLIAEVVPAEVVAAGIPQIDPATLVKVGAFIGYYGVSKCVPTITQYAVIADDDSFIDFEIPSCACRVYVYRGGAVPAAPDFSTSWLTPGLIDLGTLEAVAYRGGGALGQPIPGAADLLRVTNLVGPAALFSVVWSLHI